MGYEKLILRDHKVPMLMDNAYLPLGDLEFEFERAEALTACFGLKRVLGELLAEDVEEEPLADTALFRRYQQVLLGGEDSGFFTAYRLDGDYALRITEHTSASAAFAPMRASSPSSRPGTIPIRHCFWGIRGGFPTEKFWEMSPHCLWWRS